MRMSNNTNTMLILIRQQPYLRHTSRLIAQHFQWKTG